MVPKPSFYKRHRTLFNTSSVYNGQDVLKNHFLHKHPIVRTTSPDPLQARGYKSSTGYVWLVQDGVEILDTFPMYFRAQKKNTVYQFPHMFDNTRKVKSWTDMQLVPVDISDEFETQHEKNIVAFYDMYQGKPTFDIFYIGETLPAELEQLGAKLADSIRDAQEKSETTFLWIVPNDVTVDESFKFTYEPDGWSFDYCHVFRNGSTTYDGVILLTVYHDISKNEEAHAFYRDTKFVGTRASTPKPYDRFYISTYDEYLEAASKSSTRMFWAISEENDIGDFTFNYHVAKYDGHGRRATHVFSRLGKPMGLRLFTVDSLVSKNEFEYDHYRQKIEVDLTPNTINVK